MPSTKGAGRSKYTPTKQNHFSAFLYFHLNVCKGAASKPTNGYLDTYFYFDLNGGSSQTPEWRPPFKWVSDLVKQADDAGVNVYFKTNLLGKRRLELPFDAPIIDENAPAEDVFHYLKQSHPTN